MSNDDADHGRSEDALGGAWWIVGAACALAACGAVAIAVVAVRALRP